MKKYAIPPITTPEFTKGLEYEILATDANQTRFFIKDNNGNIRSCYFKKSESIGFNNWKIIEK
jgi:hypothetical protein